MPHPASSPIELHTPTSLARFSPEGDLLTWEVEGRPVVLDRPMRQNTRAEWRGIQLWVKSHTREPAPGQLLPVVEYTRKGEGIEHDARHLTVHLAGEGWRLTLIWSLCESDLSLSATLHADSGEKHVQLELLCWAPFEMPDRGALEGIRDGREWRYPISRFGKVASGDLDPGTLLRYRSASGATLTLAAAQPEACTHFYHRGMTVKLGSASAIAAPGETARLDVTFSVGHGPADFHPATPPPTAPVLTRAERAYKAGLMLHIQYTPHENLPALLERWVRLARQLGFDFILLELNRALRIHPACAPEALDLEAFSRLAAFARGEGMEIIPCYNLLGHQYETGLLEWHPEWRETRFDGLCVSHPEVRRFASDLLPRLLEAFDAPWVHIGGDELKLPYDTRSLQCERCGPSPNLDAIIRYWNALQHALPAGKHLAIWGDQLLPPARIAPGLTGHYWGENAEALLRALDPRVTIVDWQYSGVNPATSLHFLQQGGHAVGLASGQYVLENAFIHAEICRNGTAPFAIHTTWASPHPGDCPLESVAAAARAHAGESFDPVATPAQCTRDAQWMEDFLSR